MRGEKLDLEKRVFVLDNSKLRLGDNNQGIAKYIDFVGELANRLVHFLYNLVDRRHRIHKHIDIY